MHVLLMLSITSTPYFTLSPLQEGEQLQHPTVERYPQVGQCIKNWFDCQDGQKILLTTPTVLVGYRVEVYRAEGTTQWYTAVIQSYNHSTKVSDGAGN